MLSANTRSAARPGEALLNRAEPQQSVAIVDSLEVTFHRNRQRLPALRGVSLEVNAGEILGLVGESGSGKSVTGMALLGLLPRTAEVRGSAVVQGTDMVAATENARREARRQHLGAIFQDPMTSLDPTMTIGRQISEAATSKDAALELLRSVGVPDPERRLKAYPHQLSGGLRQRVMIAMAIASQPSLIIADEPTTALDVSVQAQILELLSELRTRLGTSMIFVTHDLAVAAQIADRIAVMYAGRIAEIGTAEQVFSEPRHPYSQGLLRSRVSLRTDRERPLATLSGEPPLLHDLPTGCPFAPRCEHALQACEEELPRLRPVAASTTKATSLTACIRAEELDQIDHEEAASWGPVATELAGYGNPRDLPLVMDNVHKSFTVEKRFRHRRTLKALRGVSLRLERGESVALVGESGSGKSTLLRVAVGLTHPDDGEVRIGEGEPPQIVFQDAGASMTPWLTIGTLLEERVSSASRADRRTFAEQALELVGLDVSIAKAKPRELSGGQRQRAAIARAIVKPPALLLCDEPTSALDVSLAANALNLIGSLRRRLGMSVLFVTHDLAAARLVGDRIAVMYLGRIVEIGPADEVISDPLHPYTKSLIASMPGAQRREAPTDGEVPSAIDVPAGCSFRARCNRAVSCCATDDPTLVAVSATQRSVACHNPVSS